MTDKMPKEVLKTYKERRKIGQPADHALKQSRLQVSWERSSAREIAISKKNPRGNR